MNMREDFLKKHGLRATDFDMQQLVDVFISEMANGLEGKNSSLRMIPTYIEADNEFKTEVPVLAIDAGGTNIRAARVTFSKDGNLDISHMVHAPMPGLERQVSKAEFFQIVAGYIQDLAAESERIGFCFSYPTEIYQNKDGKLLQFCKEIKAPEVEGTLIGKNLLEAMGMPDKKIVLLNDTVATLLFEKSPSINRSYDSYIGYILGTGTNTCYIESNRNLLKMNDLDPDQSQIINVESGNFAKAPRTLLDISFDHTTADPGSYTFEKMISGGYFGGLCLTVLQTAANEGVFSEESAGSIRSVHDLTVEQVNRFISQAADQSNPLFNAMKSKGDRSICREIIEGLIDRSAKLVAANLAAVLLKTNKGRSADHPVLITIEGTTFYKLLHLKPLFEKYLQAYLHGRMQRHYAFNQVENSSLVGAALAALIE